MSSTGKGSGSSGGSWRHDLFESGGPSLRTVSPAELRNAFHANQTRGFGDASAVDRSAFNGGTSVNVRHRSGSITEFHMHGNNFGSIRHTHQDGNQVEVRPNGQDHDLRLATTTLHNMSSQQLSQLPSGRRR
ncbi:MAG TPA: hypothetical protein VGE64_04900 [Xanthomonadaceae bacterium]